MYPAARRFSPWNRFVMWWVTVVAVVAFWGAARVGEACTSAGTKTPPQKQAAAAPAQAPQAAASATEESGMRAFIDPATGQFREPTSEEAAALTRFMAQALSFPAAPQIVQHANGAVSAQLGEEYMNDVVVRKNPDGTLSWVCVPHPLSEDVLKTPAPAKSSDLEKE